jgi:hypothetical protein
VTDDIVADLRYCADIHVGRIRHECIAEAANEIERLRNTLTVIADAVKSIDGELPGGSAYAIGRIRVELMEALYG